MRTDRYAMIVSKGDCFRMNRNIIFLLKFSFNLFLKWERKLESYYLTDPSAAWQGGLSDRQKRLTKH